MSEVSQPNELIETIEKALEAATPGPWKIDLWPRTDDIGIQQVGEITEYVTLMSRRNENRHNDANLIANAPEWLRALLEENKQLKEEIGRLKEENALMGELISAPSRTITGGYTS